VEELDGLKEGEKVLLSCEGSFARAWTGLLNEDLMDFACGGEVRAKEKVSYGHWIVGVAKITGEREELRD